jgi:hypothetical protein
MIDLAVAAIVSRDLMEQQFAQAPARRDRARGKRGANPGRKERAAAEAADPSGCGALLPETWSARTSAG